ncbi:hypothetical protein LZ30DRAFT_796216 [Colletotrichum cereale]|nr:hypothetical protein LZ30DRAFT_796216 [Colletotrichum cereale]
MGYGIRNLKAECGIEPKDEGGGLDWGQEQPTGGHHNPDSKPHLSRETGCAAPLVNVEHSREFDDSLRLELELREGGRRKVMGGITRLKPVIGRDETDTRYFPLRGRCAVELKCIGADRNEGRGRARSGLVLPVSLTPHDKSSVKKSARADEAGHLQTQPLRSGNGMTKYGLAAFVISTLSVSDWVKLARGVGGAIQDNGHSDLSRRCRDASVGLDWVLTRASVRAGRPSCTSAGAPHPDLS